MDFSWEYYIVMLMRKFLFSFLILLMLTPSLACAMPSCHGEVEQTVTQLCHDAQNAADHSPKSKHETGKVNLLLDCMGVDLQTADVVSVDKTDLKQAPITFAIAADFISDRFAPHDGLTIRGPPPDNLYLSYPTPSLILTTQRFRI